MTRRYFRNGQATTLAFPVDALSTTIEVNSATSFPTQFPYTLILDPDGALEEVVDVTNGTGTLLTVTRGADGTTASGHSAGVQVYHGVSARDADEANAHVNATTNVHGANGALVDVASAQSITGAKDFTTITKGGVALVDTSSAQTVNGLKTFGTRPTTSSNGDLVSTAGTQTISGDRTHSGAQTFTGTESHAGAETHTGTETHAGTETHSGDVTHSGKVRFTHADMAVKSAFSSTDEVTTSATFSAGSSPCGIPFTAPPSGSIMVFLASWLQQDANDQTAIASFGIYTGSTPGSGTEIVAPSGDRAISIGGTVTTGVPIRAQLGRADPVVGLTPGTEYVATVMLQTTTPGTGRAFNRKITVLPLAG